MRKTVEPPPSTQCGQCGGQLKLKRVDVGHSVLGLNCNIFFCTACDRECSHVAPRDLYAAHQAMPQRGLRG